MGAFEGAEDMPKLVLQQTVCWCTVQVDGFLCAGRRFVGLAFTSVKSVCAQCP